MSRLTTTIVATLVSILATTGLASAQEEHMQLRCSAAPGDARDLDCVATREVKREVADRTHSSIFPTGNLVRKGEVQYQVHELGLINRASIGLTDNVEISVSAPLLPLFGGVGVRIGLLPRESQYRLVVGAGVWAPMVGGDDAERLIQSNVTVAYQNQKLNVHGSIGAIKPLGHDDALLTYTAGFVYKAGPKYALIGEALRLTMASASASTDSCADYEGDCGGGGSEHLDGALVGVKLMGEHFDTDLGLFVPFGESDIVGLPVVSMTYRY
jgi:hypothetical protein